MLKEIIKNIKEKDKDLNAFVTICENSEDNGNPTIAVKDNISTKGILTTCSSKMLYNYTPVFDATVVTKIKDAGLQIVGKTNMDEFAMGSSTETSYFKKTRNPKDFERVPGGSSGGSAAAVAAGLVPLALGSDTGGSIRQPAAFCGCIGLKPTYGSVSRYGLIAFASSLDQIGTFARSVENTRFLYNIISGQDKMDATSSKKAIKVPELQNNVKGLKIGLPKEYFGEGIKDYIKTAVMNSVNELEKAGAIVKEISLPSTKYAINIYYIIASAEASSNLARYDGVKYGYRTKEYENLIDMYEKTRSEGFGDEVKRRIMLGTFVLSSGFYDAYYKKAKIIQKNIMSEFDNAFKDVDVIATPTTPDIAFKFGEISDPVTMYYNDVCTVAVNIAGLPGISLPCGNYNNLPIGLQFITNKFQEDVLLNTSYSFEQLRGGSLC